MTASRAIRLPVAGPPLCHCDIIWALCRTVSCLRFCSRFLPPSLPGAPPQTRNRCCFDTPPSAALASSSPSPTTSGASVATAAMPSISPPASEWKATRFFRPTDRRSLSPASMTAISMCSSCPPRAVRPSASPTIPRRTAPSAGPPMVSRCSSPPIAPATPTSAASSPSPPKAAPKLSFHWTGPWRARTPPTAPNSPTCRPTSGRGHGSVTAAARPPIWLATLSDSSVLKIPRNNSNDFNPMWVGDTVYFLSDRNGPVSLFAYDTKSKQVTEAVKNTGLDFKSASAGPDAIVYEQFGSIHIYDLKSRKTRDVAVRLTGDLPELRPHFRKIAPNEIRGAGISPTGARAVFVAHGEVFSVPAEKGDIRNLTNSPAAEEREPAWSSDGKSIAYFSDASGEYTLEIRDQNGLGEPRRIVLGHPPAFPYAPRWSPDSKKIAYTDKTLNVCYVELEKGTPVRIDTDIYAGPMALNPAWSPDSKWIAYTRKLKSHLHAVFVYSLDQNKTFQVTDGMSDAANAQFDQEGKYLYFTASTDTALSSGWLDMSSIQRPVTRSVYLAVLAKDLPSPLAPESDEEKPPAPDAKKPDDTAKKETTVRIDLENISQRILALPIPARNYVSMSAGKTGVLFLVEAPMVSPMTGPGEGLTVHTFDLKTRKTDKIREGINSFILSADFVGLT